MKKLINRSFLYAMIALAAGVFYREFTKWKGFTGRTTLAFMHPHLLVLGSLLLLIAALFSAHSTLQAQKSFKTFLLLHTIGLPLMSVMMLVRGILQVLGSEVSKGLNGAVSGIAGLAHVVMAAALVCFFLALRRAITSGKEDDEPKRTIA